MSDWFAGLGPILQALVAALGTWGVTAAGAALVFFFREINRRLLDGMLGFAAGVMIAASFWSLLAPSIEMAEAQGIPRWLPAVVGFLAGGVVLRAFDAVLPHLHLFGERSEAEGLPTGWDRSVLLVTAITLHNIPEGLAIGVAFGAAAAGAPGASLGAAIALAIGIAIQNFPEGTGVAAPLRRDGMRPLKAFWYGQLSAAVEPVAAVLGAFAVITVQPLLPYALAFAAGAMIFVVVEELIPEAERSGHTDIATTGAMIGFATMMFLDVAFS